MQFFLISDTLMRYAGRGGHSRARVSLQNLELMLKDLRILVADDDPSILEIVATYLNSLGHHTVTCPDGAEGLKILAEDEFDLIVSDVRMAGLNGFEFLRTARLLCPDIGFVIMTAYEDRYPLSEALRAGADGYISKPFTFNKFSLIFERAYWTALSRQDWWENHQVEASSHGDTLES